MADDILIFGGSGSPKLTRKICEYVDVQPGAGEVLRFSEGNLFVRVQENVRGRRVYLVQSTVFPANDHFMELLFRIDALRRASAESVTVVMPYFSYAKGDKKDEPRVSIRARVCADAIEVAGADRVVTLDLHAPQIQGFFRIPVDDLYALPILCAAIARQQLPDLVVVSPDTGFVKQARKYASCLGAALAIADKQRKAHDERAEVLEIIGEVRGKTAVIVDDFTISAGTLADAAEKLIERGANAVYTAVSHVSLANTPSGDQVLELSARIWRRSRSMITVLLHLFRLLPFLIGGHRQLALENLALRQQLAVYRRTGPRPKLRTTDRLLWVGLARVWAGWRQALVIVSPDTVLR